ncbi:MAG: cobalamin-dependent protein [Melioribacteraceae bacterium]|jgi:methanogenic corrinoid protein MtbC1|nr:cobalamin-dependent protein [Melioribacteraceae bacterium]
MISEATYLHYLNALLDGNKAECTRIINTLLADDTDVKEIYTKLFQRSMYRIGHLWESNRSSIAEEHIATKITESLLNLVYPKILETPRNGKKIVITCVDKEFHEIGPRIVSDFFELNGWESIFLGANTPANEVLNIIKEKKPDLVGISNSFYINILRLVKLIELIKSELPEQEIIVGGQALANDTNDVLSKFEKVTYLSGIDKLDEFIKLSQSV